jgi:hypothetical protein
LRVSSHMLSEVLGPHSELSLFPDIQDCLTRFSREMIDNHPRNSIFSSAE